MIQLIAISDMQDLPAIRKVSLLDILGEGNGSVAIDGDILIMRQRTFKYNTGLQRTVIVPYLEEG